MAAGSRGQRWEKVGGLAVATVALLGAITAPRAAGAVYWVNNPNPGAETIGRVNLDGTGYDPDFIKGAADPCGVAVDGRHIYWANRVPVNSIGRANLNGSGVNHSFISGGLVTPCGPSVNGQYIYWANTFGGGGAQGTIGRAKVDGSAVSADFAGGPTVSSPGMTAIDDDFVYWTNTDINGPAPVEPSIYRQEIDVSPPQVVVPASSSAPILGWPSLSPNRLFFAVSTLGIRSTDREGNNGSNVTLANAAGGTAIRGDKLYWLSQPDGNLSRANLDGSSPQFTLLRGLENPLGLALDGLRLAPFEFGALRRQKRRGTATLVVFLPEPGRLVLAGKGVKRRVLRAPEGKVKLRIRPKPGVRRKLDDTGRARVRARITHTPDGGEPGRRAKPIRLIQL